jgi:hypothetical protein
MGYVIVRLMPEADKAVPVSQVYWTREEAAPELHRWREHHFWYPHCHPGTVGFQAIEVGAR